jgi:uncharacterized protein
MADSGLADLYRLHLVDAALHDLQAHAAALDVGKAEAKQIQDIESDPAGTLGKALALKREVKDLEGQQGSLREKLKKLDKDLYGGSIVNPREVENVQKDMAMVQAQIDGLDERLLALYEEVPVAEAAASDVKAETERLRATIAKKQAEAKAEHAKLQAEYAATSKRRAPLAEKVPRPLLAQYDALRQKLGTGMAIVTPTGRCGHCGMLVPEKARDALRQERVVQCEQCRRILFNAGGAV